MILEQFYLGCLAHASYILIDERTRTAAVIDPQRDVEQYLAKAAEHGATIEHVLLTHFHADFVAGHLELRERTGARIYLGAQARAEYDFTPLAEGDELRFGDVRLSILETPGHTPEGISILVFDEARDAEAPHAVFTGDTLFVGDVGRPDLMASVGITSEELAGMLYDSLRDKLMQLPEATLVYPAHGAGSMCGKNLGTETFSTIGTQLQLNYALQPMAREEFVRVVSAAQPQAPAYFGYDAQLNKQVRPLLEDALARVLVALQPEEVLAKRDAGAQVLDVREADAFAAGHLRGSLNVGLDGKFATWSGSVLEPEREIVVIAPTGKEREVATRLGRIGFDGMVGFLAGGYDALAAHPDQLATSARVAPAALQARLEKGEDLVVLDVRGPGEVEAGHVGDSLSIPLPALASRWEEVPTDRPVAVICKSGYRSSAATSLLRARGLTDVLDVTGGMDAWQAGGHPVATPATT